MTISKHEFIVITMICTIAFIALNYANYFSLDLPHTNEKQAYDTRCYSAHSLNPYTQEQESRYPNHRYAYLLFYPQETIHGYFYDYDLDREYSIEGEYQGSYSTISGRSVGQYTVEQEGTTFEEQRSIVFDEHGITFIDTQGNTAVLPLISCQRLNEWNIAYNYVFKEGS
jgi:hypothetical protein